MKKWFALLVLALLSAPVLAETVKVNKAPHDDSSQALVSVDFQVCEVSKRRDTLLLSGTLSRPKPTVKPRCPSPERRPTWR